MKYILLISRVLNPEEHPGWDESVDEKNTQIAISELSWQAYCNERVRLLTHGKQPAINDLMDSSFPKNWICETEDPLSPEILAQTVCAILIGGTGVELDLARRIRNEGFMVWPIASTNGAAGQYLEEALQKDGDFSPETATMLAMETDYAAIFERILSL